MKVLEVKNLKVVLNGDAIVEDINFDLEEGDVVALIGPNGSGKTTLFKALLGLVPHTGQVMWRGEVSIGYTPQRFHIDKNLPLTVEEFLSLEMRSRRKGGAIIPQDNITRCLDEVGTAHLVHKRLAELSGGQLQRVLIARALVSNPNVFLFDEPTAGIDVGGEETIYVLLKRIADARHLSVMLISHDLNVVYKFADKVICINKTMTCYGAPEEVLTPEQLALLYREHTAFYKHAPHHH